MWGGQKQTVMAQTDAKARCYLLLDCKLDIGYTIRAVVTCHDGDFASKCPFGTHYQVKAEQASLGFKCLHDMHYACTAKS